MSSHGLAVRPLEQAFWWCSSTSCGSRDPQRTRSLRSKGRHIGRAGGPTARSAS
jgi:hypothetical protein